MINSFRYNRGPLNIHLKNSRRSKCGKRIDLGGKYFRSAWEANYARYLNFLVNNKSILKWEYESDTFEFINIKRGTRFYTPDFKIYENNGKIVYHEVKGYMDKKSATRMKRMKKHYPNIPVVLIDKDYYKSLNKQLKHFIAGWE